MHSAQYDFLRTNPRLGNRIILMGLLYRTFDSFAGNPLRHFSQNYKYAAPAPAAAWNPLRFRGITLNLPSDLLGFTEFEQYEDNNTDTVIYAFNKIIKLLLE